MVKYAISMSVRMVCIVAMLFVTGWWLLLCVIGAIVLPYVAVVLANEVSHRPNTHPVAPGALAIAPPLRVSESDWNEPKRGDTAREDS